MSEFTKENIDEFRVYRNNMPSWIKGHSRYDKIPTKLFEDALDEITSLRAELERVKAALQNADDTVMDIIGKALSGECEKYLNYDLSGNKYCKWGIVEKDIRAALLNAQQTTLPAAPEEGE